MDKHRLAFTMSTNKPKHGSGSSTHGNQTQTQSLTGAVAELSSPKPHRIQKALIQIRTQFLKEKDGISRLRQRGGLPKLIHILEGDNEKLIDIALSILGNCCMDQKFRQEVCCFSTFRMSISGWMNCLL